MKFIFSFIAVFCLVSSGCGGDQSSQAVDVGAVDAKAPLNKPVDGDTDKENNNEKPAPRKGVILRAELNKILADGPAGILKRVKTEPFFMNGQFIGFKITAFNGSAPVSIDLKPGDVLLSVNGHKVERPEDFFKVIEELKSRESLDFTVLRDGSRHRVAYPIED